MLTIHGGDSYRVNNGATGAAQLLERAGLGDWMAYRPLEMFSAESQRVAAPTDCTVCPKDGKVVHGTSDERRPRAALDICANALIIGPVVTSWLVEDRPADFSGDLQTLLCSAHATVVSSCSSPASSSP